MANHKKATQRVNAKRAGRIVEGLRSELFHGTVNLDGARDSLRLIFERRVWEAGYIDPIAGLTKFIDFKTMAESPPPGLDTNYDDLQKICSDDEDLVVTLKIS